MIMPGECKLLAREITIRAKKVTFKKHDLIRGRQLYYMQGTNMITMISNDRKKNTLKKKSSPKYWLISNLNVFILAQPEQPSHPVLRHVGPIRSQQFHLRRHLRIVDGMRGEDVATLAVEVVAQKGIARTWGILRWGWGSGGNTWEDMGMHLLDTLW